MCLCSGSECTNLLCLGCLNPNFTCDPFNVEIKRHKSKIRFHTSRKQVKCEWNGIQKWTRMNDSKLAELGHKNLAKWMI